MQALTVDASALLLVGRDPSLAGRLASQFSLLAPRLLAWEVGQVVHIKHRLAFGPLASRQVIVRDLLRPFTLFDQSGALDDVAALADRHGLTFYDAAYVEVAKSQGTPLLTEDGAMHGAAGRELGAAHAWRLPDAARAIDEHSES